MSVLVMLDLSAAFDTVDHNVLFNVLSDRFGIQPNDHDWCRSHHAVRLQAFTISNDSSNPVALTYGVPQVSVIGLKEFVVYTGDIVDTIDNFCILMARRCSCICILKRLWSVDDLSSV